MSARAIPNLGWRTFFRAGSMSFMPICAMTCTLPPGTEHHLSNTEQIGSPPRVLSVLGKSLTLFCFGLEGSELRGQTSGFVLTSQDYEVGPKDVASGCEHFGGNPSL